MNVLDDLGPFGECTEEGFLNWVCFTLKSLSWATESPLAERHVSASDGMEMASVELENCLSAEEVYLLDKRTSTYRN